MEVAKKKRGKGGLRSEAVADKPVVVAEVLHPTPRDLKCAGASIKDCQVCGAHWDARAREDDEPVYHRTFILEDVELPVYRIYLDPWTNKKTGDIWCPIGGGVLPIVIRKYLCPKCYYAAWDRGLEEWCAEQLADHQRSRFGETMDRAVAVGELPEECGLLLEDPIQLCKFVAIFTRFAVCG